MSLNQKMTRVYEIAKSKFENEIQLEHILKMHRMIDQMVKNLEVSEKPNSKCYINIDSDNLSQDEQSDKSIINGGESHNFDYATQSESNALRTQRESHLIALKTQKNQFSANSEPSLRDMFYNENRPIEIIKQKKTVIEEGERKKKVILKNEMENYFEICK